MTLSLSRCINYTISFSNLLKTLYTYLIKTFSWKYTVYCPIRNTFVLKCRIIYIYLTLIKGSYILLFHIYKIEIHIYIIIFSALLLLSAIPDVNVYLRND